MKCSGTECECIIDLKCDDNYIGQIDDITEKRLKSEIKKIQKGGATTIGFENYKDDTCMALCRAKEIQNGCNFGYRCGVRFF